MHTHTHTALQQCHGGTEYVYTYVYINTCTYIHTAAAFNSRTLKLFAWHWIALASCVELFFTYVNIRIESLSNVLPTINHSQVKRRETRTKRVGENQRVTKERG